MLHLITWQRRDTSSFLVWITLGFSWVLPLVLGLDAWLFSLHLQSLTGKFRPLFSYFEEPEIISQKAVRKRDEGTGESLRKVSSSFSIINSRSSRINVVLVQLILRERPSGTSNSLSLSVFISILDLHSFYLLTSFLFHVLHRCFLFQFLLTELPQH